MKSKKDCIVKFKLSRDDRDEIDYICEKKRCTISELMRSLIHEKYIEIKELNDKISLYRR